jgi:hypothetical protein
VVYVPSPDIGLEIRGARTIATVADFEPVELLRKRAYFGRVDQLVVVLPTKFSANGKEQAILRSFKAYAPDRWMRTRIGSFAAFEQRSVAGLPHGSPEGDPPTTGTSGR